MTYSIDLRETVISYINNGGSKVGAARIFNISRNTLYRWLRMDDLRPQKSGLRHRKIDKAALKAHAQEFSDMYLHERAVVFGVHTSSMGRMLKKLSLSVVKRLFKVKSKVLFSWSRGVMSMPERRFMMPRLSFVLMAIKLSALVRKPFIAKPAGTWETITVKLSDYNAIGSQIDNLVFVNDDDDDKTGDVLFRDIKVFENGTSGADTLNGSAFNETLFGHEGDDILYGNDGDDILYGVTGLTDEDALETSGNLIAA